MVNRIRPEPFAKPPAENFAGATAELAISPLANTFRCRARRLGWLHPGPATSVRQRNQKHAIIVRVHKNGQTQLRINCHGVRAQHKR